MLRSDRRLLLLAICLSALAGFIDSIGFLHAGGFFVSFMSGNSTRFAVGVSEGASAALTALGLIAGFVTGVTLGAVIGHTAGTRRRTVVLLTVTLLLLVAAAVAPFNGTAPMIAMVLAMGIENAALADNGEVKVGLTYMTGALVRIGHSFGNVLMGLERLRWTADMGLWCGLVSGAIGGALAYRWLAMDALWLATAAAAVLTFAAHRLGRAGTA